MLKLTILKDFNIFDNIFLEEIASTAGFSNVLAHDYMKLNEKIVIKYINKILDLYPKYIKKMRNVF